MYNDAQINRAGALEQLNKLFLGKDEQIALSELPHLRSPQRDPRQVMPRGYEQGDIVTGDNLDPAAGSLLGPSSTPGMVIDRDFFGQKGLNVEFDPRTGSVTDLGRKAVAAYTDPKLNNPIINNPGLLNGMYSELEMTNQESLSTNALAAMGLQIDLQKEAAKKGITVQELLDFPKTPKEATQKAAKVLGTKIVSSAVGIPFFGMFALWAGRRFDLKQQEMIYNRQLALRAKAKAEEEKTVSVIEQNVEPTVPPTQPQSQEQTQSVPPSENVTYQELPPLSDTSGWAPRSGIVGDEDYRSMNLIGPPQQLASPIPTPDYFTNLFNIRTGRTYTPLNWQTNTPVNSVVTDLDLAAYHREFQENLPVGTVSPAAISTDPVKEYEAKELATSEKALTEHISDTYRETGKGLLATTDPAASVAPVATPFTAPDVVPFDKEAYYNPPSPYPLGREELARAEAFGRPPDPRGIDVGPSAGIDVGSAADTPAPAPGNVAEGMARGADPGPNWARGGPVNMR